MQNIIKIIVIKVNDGFYFESYLHLFNAESVKKILSYRFRIDQIRSFASELLKYYYLAKVLNIVPNKINISNSELGKPEVIIHDNTYLQNKNIHFSISHSGEYVVMAIFDKPVGIDIEEIDHNIDVVELGKMVFSESEKNIINNNIKNFFLLWTKKEALFKARGTGFINDYYNQTNLNLELIEQQNSYNIHSQLFTDKYYLSICIL